MGSDWKVYALEDLLSYEQPTPYIVESTEYSDSYKTPVLTAGKSFILGYTNENHSVYDALPVIIFDDFTTASQYVNFKFKVKSSAMKILSANTELVLPKFIFYRMQIIKFDASTHKRYWIQHYSKIKVKIPSLDTQERIVARIEELFSQLDASINELKTAKERLKVYRQAVLKEAFDSALQDNPPMMPIEELLTTERKGMSTGPFGTMIKKHEHQTSGVPMLGIENIGDGKFIDGNKIFVTPEKAKELKSFAFLSLRIGKNMVRNILIVYLSWTNGSIYLMKIFLFLNGLTEYIFLEKKKKLKNRSKLKLRLENYRPSLLTKSVV